MNISNNFNYYINFVCKFKNGRIIDLKEYLKNSKYNEITTKITFSGRTSVTSYYGQSAMVKSQIYSINTFGTGISRGESTNYTININEFKNSEIVINASASGSGRSYCNIQSNSIGNNQYKEYHYSYGNITLNTSTTLLLYDFNINGNTIPLSIISITE